MSRSIAVITTNNLPESHGRRAAGGIAAATAAAAAGPQWHLGSFEVWWCNREATAQMPHETVKHVEHINVYSSSLRNVLRLRGVVEVLLGPTREVLYPVTRAGPTAASTAKPSQAGSKHSSIVSNAREQCCTWHAPQIEYTSKSSGPGLSCKWSGTCCYP
jgi:hypothetical protein